MMCPGCRDVKNWLFPWHWRYFPLAKWFVIPHFMIPICQLDFVVGTAWLRGCKIKELHTLTIIYTYIICNGGKRGEVVQEFKTSDNHIVCSQHKTRFYVFMVYLTMLSVARPVRCEVIESLMIINNEWWPERMSEKAVVASFLHTISTFAWRNWGKP